MFIAQLSRRRLLDIAVVLFLASLIFLIVQRPLYTSSAIIRVENSLSGSSAQKGRELDPDIKGLILDRIGSAESISATIDYLGLRKRYRSDQHDQQVQDHAVSQFRKRLSLEATSTPSVWVVKYRSDNANATTATLDELLNRLGQSEQRMALAQGRRPERMRQNDQDVLFSAALETLGAAKAALGAQEALTRADIELLLTQISSNKDHTAPNGNPLSSGGKARTGDASFALSELRDQRSELSLQRAELAKRYGPRYPLMVDLDERLKRIELLIDTQNQLDSVRAAEAAAASLATSDARKLLADAQTSAASDGREAQSLERAGQQIQAARASLGTVLSATGVEPPGDQVSLHVLARATTPLRRDRSIAEGLAGAGALLAVLLAAAAVSRRPKAPALFEAADDVLHGLGLPAAAIIPDISAGSELTGDERQRRPIDGLTGQANPDFVAAFTAIGETLCRERSGPLVAAVCSATPGEGKTTVAICLARSEALGGRRVLLIDCDGRKRAASELFADAKGAGLVQLLRGETPLSQALLVDPTSGACVIRHSSTSQIEDLSAPAQLKALLAQVRSQFDLVILDTGPVLLLAEARVVAALADKVLLVSRWRRTPVGSTRHALRLLQEAGAHVVAVALTMANINSDPHSQSPVGH